MSTVSNVRRKMHVYILYDIPDKAIQGYMRPHLKASTVMVVCIPRKMHYGQSS